MCKFSFKVRLCGCEDSCCKQRTGALNFTLKEPGHILRIFEYRRVSGMCIDWFPNHDPNRLVLRYGFPADGTNSTQDCRGDKQAYIKDETERDLQICDKCLRSCKQPEISPSVLEEVCAKLVVAMAKKDAKNHKKAKIAAKADALNYRELLEDRERRHKRDEFRYTMARPKNLRREGSLKKFDDPRLLHPGERSAVYELARQRTVDLPRKRRIARQEEKIGLVFYQRHFDEERREAKAEARKGGKEEKRFPRDGNRTADAEASHSPKVRSK